MFDVLLIAFGLNLTAFIAGLVFGLWVHRSSGAIEARALTEAWTFADALARGKREAQKRGRESK